MGLFRTPKKSSQMLRPAGRRRPIVDRDQSTPANPAFSYYAQRSYHPENTGRLEADKAIQRDRLPREAFATRHRLLVATLGGIFGLGVLYCLMLSPEPRIVLLQDKATAYFLQDPNVYRQAAAGALGSSLLARNKLTVDTAALRLSLLKDYPEIKNVAIAMPLLGHQPQVYIEPYKPSFILTTTDRNAFLLDATGRALATASQIPNIDSLHVSTLQDHSGMSVKLGTRALPSTTVSYAQTVVAALAAKQVDISVLVLPPAAYELDAYIAGTSYFVKFNLQADPLQGAGTYLATRGRLAADKVKPAQYVDVRVPERAYYK